MEKFWKLIIFNGKTHCKWQFSIVYPLVMTNIDNIAMENGPFIDGLAIKNGDFPWLC